jgi:hypothetical protein
MLPVFWLLLVLVGTCLFVLMLLPWGVQIYSYYGGGRAVTCPETRQQVAVSFDALHATVTMVTGKSALRLADCTRWPMRADCGQECVPEALRTAPYTQGEVQLPKTKRIYHLPVVAAAFAAWVLGAIWHSQYLLRTRWMQAVGLRGSDLRQIVWWLTPHLLSAAMCFLFAYGVACLLALRRREGTRQAILTSVLLWFAIAAASLAATGLAGVPGDLLRIEAVYTFLASLVVGAIIGGLSGKLVERALEGG